MDINQATLSIKRLFRERPFVFLCLCCALFMVVWYTLVALEINPEFEGLRMPEQKEPVLTAGENLVWLGMEVTAINREIRKEFKVPRKVKGVFVVNDGAGKAHLMGVRTADIICSINRVKVTGRNSFIKTAGSAKFYDGILLDIYRDGKRFFISIPYEYIYGPLLGPNKGHWQMRSPVITQAFPYSPLIK